MGRNILAALAQVRGGESRLVLVSGYSGVGKRAYQSDPAPGHAGLRTIHRREIQATLAATRRTPRWRGRWGLLQLLLAQRPEEVAGWREQLHRALRDNLPSSARQSLS